MLNRNIKENKQVLLVSLDDLVPSGHLVRKINEAMDFNFIIDEVKDLYCLDNGRMSVNPVMLFKIVLVQYMFGIKSMRQTVKEIEVNVAYRWFVGLDLLDKVPSFATFSMNYKRRFKNTDIFEKIFSRILSKAMECGFVDTDTVFLDSTHIKASANKKKKIEEYVKKTAKSYQKTLEKEINKDRVENGKKEITPPDDDDKGDFVKKTKSTTDPECGEFHKGEHEKMFAYSAHTVVDKKGFVLSSKVTPANVHDSVMFDEIYKETLKNFNFNYIALDAGYKTPWIAKQILDSNKTPLMPYKRRPHKKGYWNKNEFVYDEYYDCYLCPHNEILEYSTTNKLGYKEYKSNSRMCELCPDLDKCTANKKFQKLITKHIWEDYIEQAEDIRLSKVWKELYPLRSETVERVFADAKEKHGARYTQLRGKAKVQMSVTLIFACMNLKKLANWLAKTPQKALSFLQKLVNFAQNMFKTKTLRIYA